MIWLMVPLKEAHKLLALSSFLVKVLLYTLLLQRSQCRTRFADAGSHVDKVPSVK